MTLRKLIQGGAGAAAVVAVPAVEPSDAPRLDLADCLEFLTETHAGIWADYPVGALAVLELDAELSRRFHETEERIDTLAKVAGGPTESDFRRALADHAAVWREIFQRSRAHEERQAERVDPMPDLPDDTALAIGVSYGDGEPGTWDVVRQGRRQ